MIGYFRFALIAVMLAGIAGASAIVTMQFAVHGTVVSVPALEGLRVDEAVQKAAELGLDVAVTQKFYSTALPEGRVLLQSPAASARVRRGWNIAVAESLGPQRIAIPDTVGKSEREAMLLIRQKGLELGELAQMPDAQVPAGTVLAQDPAPDAKGAAAPSVSLLVAEAPTVETPTYVMPDEVGRSYAEAAEEMSKTGIAVASTQSVPAGAQIVVGTAAGTVAGIVVAQQPPAGARIEKGSRVVLSVAGGGATGVGAVAASR